MTISSPRAQALAARAVQRAAWLVWRTAWAQRQAAAAALAYWAGGLAQRAFARWRLLGQARLAHRQRLETAQATHKAKLRAAAAAGWLLVSDRAVAARRHAAVQLQVRRAHRYGCVVAGHHGPLNFFSVLEGHPRRPRVGRG